MSKNELLREAMEREFHAMDASRTFIRDSLKEWIGQAVDDTSIPARDFLRRSLQSTAIESFLLISEMCGRAAKAALDAILDREVPTP